ncbi:MAG: hypothetical protein LBV50_02650 [Novosphingobium sp.]|nr:hypothetical protein [Novosphingobium sp.]
MNLAAIVRLASPLVLAASLSGCMDLTSEIDVLSDASARSTSTVTLSNAVYAIVKQDESSHAENAADKPFCKENGATLTENADGSAACTAIKEGDFATITGTVDANIGTTTFTTVKPGVVRVAISTETLTRGMASEQKNLDSRDEQARTQIKAAYAGHAITIRIKGRKVIDTNMTVTADGVAQKVIPFEALIDGSANLPGELFAVVDTR